ncbi:MAG: type II and III secretion system protein, partial [Planctomycetes bacterium]|nr:type II and III secretion system protein [Planctomycetota bacterium]
GGGGGGGGSSSSDEVGSWRSRWRAYELILTILQTIEPQSWWTEGGDGRISQFAEKKLIIWQTPEVHQKIKEFLDYLREDLGQQIAIETRFLLVDENFLDYIGLDISRLTIEQPGRRINEGLPLDFRQDSERHVFEQIFSSGTNISSTLGGALGGSTVGGGSAFWVDSVVALDDLTVDFMIRATQAQRNSRQLTAPKVVVMNGESATMNVQTQKRIKSSSDLVTDSTTTEGVTNTYAYWEVEHEDITTGIYMSITPTITADKKYVLLRIMTNLSELLDTTPVTTVGITPFSDEPLTDTYDLPLTQNSSVMTRVSVPDRGTVMLGGLTLTSEREMESGVPVLGKLPLLGRLFSNRSQIKDKQILLILVKPTIMLQQETEEDAIGALAQQSYQQ